MRKKNKKRKVYILGSGPTGLISAWRFVERGWDVTIIEKQKITGVYAVLGNGTILF